MNKILVLLVLAICWSDAGCKNGGNITEARTGNSEQAAVEATATQTPLPTAANAAPVPAPTSQANVDITGIQPLLAHIDNPKPGERYKPSWLDDEQKSDNGFEPFCMQREISRKTVEKCGYQDAAGKILIKPAFDKVFVFSEGLAGVCPDVEQLCGYINENGRMIIKANYQSVGVFSEGLGMVAIGDVDYYKHGYLDKQGKFVIKPQYSDGEPFKNGTAQVKLRNLSFCINKKGERVECVE